MAFAYFLGNPCLLYTIIVELAERSPIIIQNSSNPSSRKNLVVRPYDRTTVRPYDRTTVRPYKVLLLTCVVNCAPGSESDDPGSSPGRGKALCP